MNGITRAICVIALTFTVAFTLAASAPAFNGLGGNSAGAWLGSEGPNDPGEIPDFWVPWDVPIEPLSPCELGIGGDGCTIGEGGVGMPGPDLPPGIYLFDYQLWTAVDNTWIQPDYTDCEGNGCGEIW